MSSIANHAGVLVLPTKLAFVLDSSALHCEGSLSPACPPHVTRVTSWDMVGSAFCRLQEGRCKFGDAKGPKKGDDKSKGKAKPSGGTMRRRPTKIGVATLGSNLHV